MPLLEEMLSEAGIGWRDICAIGVGTGPGNFTGVRISVAAARGLALGLGIPAIGVTVLEAMAHGAPRPVTVILDARRDEVYVQHFGDDQDSPAQILAMGSARFGPIIGLGGAEPVLPLAEAIARIAARRRHDPHPRPAPFYLRGADASPPSDPPPVILP